MLKYNMGRYKGVIIAVIVGLLVAAGSYYLIVNLGGEQASKPTRPLKEQKVESSQKEEVSTEPTASATQTPSVTQTTTETPTSTPTVTPSPTPTVTPTSTSSEGEAEYDAGFITGLSNKQSQAVGSATYSVSSDNKAIVKTQGGSTTTVYTTDNIISKFRVSGSYVYVIENKTDEPNHFYFKRARLGGSAVVFWHYISSYIMQDFLINPAEYGSTKTFYLLFTKQNGLLVLKIVNYKLDTSATKTVRFTEYLGWHKVKDQDAVVIDLKDGEEQKHVKIELGGGEETYLFHPLKLAASLCS